MSFKCQLCGHVSPNGTKPRKVVLETRPQVYKNEKGAIVGRGREIAKEADACEGCAS